MTFDFSMVAIAQPVEHWIVIPGVAGSIPVGHPKILAPAFRSQGGIRGQLI